MKVEIRKIGIWNMLFSVFPVAVFVVMLLSGFMETFSPDVTVNVNFIMRTIMNAIVSTLLFLLSSVVFLLAYNLLCAIGIRGIRVELEDK